jgi:hypothetical protein
MGKGPRPTFLQLQLPVPLQFPNPIVVYNNLVSDMSGAPTPMTLEGLNAKLDANLRRALYGNN